LKACIISIVTVFLDDVIHKDKIISVSWNKNGELLATCCKDKLVRLLDPRTTEVVATATNHKNDKDSRVTWLGDSQFVLTSGFDSVRSLLFKNHYKQFFIYNFLHFFRVDYVKSLFVTQEDLIHQ
jgi:WD40 repeat protein